MGGDAAAAPLLRTAPQAGDLWPRVFRASLSCPSGIEDFYRHFKGAQAELEKVGGGTEQTPADIITGIPITPEHLILHLKEITAQAQQV